MDGSVLQIFSRSAAFGGQRLHFNRGAGLTPGDACATHIAGLRPAGTAEFQSKGRVFIARSGLQRLSRSAAFACHGNQAPVVWSISLPLRFEIRQFGNGGIPCKHLEHIPGRRCNARTHRLGEHTGRANTQVRPYMLFLQYISGGISYNVYPQSPHGMRKIPFRGQGVLAGRS